MPNYILDRERKISVFTDPEIYCLAAFLAWVKEQNSTDERFIKVMESGNRIYAGLKGFQQVDSQEIENELKETRKILRYFHPDKIASSPFIEFFTSFATDEAIDAGMRDLVTKQAAGGNVAQVVSLMTTSAITKILDVPESSKAFDERIQQQARDELAARETGKTRLDRAIDKIMGTDEADNSKSKHAASATHGQAVKKYGIMAGELLPFLANLLDIKMTPLEATSQMKSASKSSRSRASSEETDGGAVESSSWFGSFGSPFDFSGFGFGKKAEAKAHVVRKLDAEELKTKQKYNEQIAAFIDGVSLVIDALHKAWVENDPNAFAQLRDNPKVQVMVKLLDEAKQQAVKDQSYFSFVRYEWLEAAIKAIKENKEPVLVKVDWLHGSKPVPRVDLFDQLAYHFMMQKGQDTKVLQIFFAGLSAKNASKLEDISNRMQGRFPLGSETSRNAAQEYASKHGVHSSTSETKAFLPKAAPQVTPPVAATWKAAPAKPVEAPVKKKEFVPQQAAEGKKTEPAWVIKAREMEERRKAGQTEYGASGDKNKPSGKKG